MEITERRLQIIQVDFITSSQDI